MFAWLFLLVLLAVEVLVLRWWLRREFYPVFFNGWAALLYGVVLAVDFILTWLVSTLFTPGGTMGTAALAIVGGCLVVVVFLGTLFFRWVIRIDLNEPSEKP
jgi:hypothetical protein